MQTETRMLCLKSFREDTTRNSHTLQISLICQCFTHQCTCGPTPHRLAREITERWEETLTDSDRRRTSSRLLLRPWRSGFPTCWRGWDEKQRLFVPLVLRCPFALLPSQLAARSRPTPHHTEQPIRGRLSILTPPSPVQPPGLQKHTTGAGKDPGAGFPLTNIW